MGTEQKKALVWNMRMRSFPDIFQKDPANLLEYTK